MDTIELLYAYYNYDANYKKGREHCTKRNDKDIPGCYETANSLPDPADISC